MVFSAWPGVLATALPIIQILRRSEVNIRRVFDQMVE